MATIIFRDALKSGNTIEEKNVNLGEPFGSIKRRIFGANYMKINFVSMGRILKDDQNLKSLNINPGDKVIILFVRKDDGNIQPPINEPPPHLPIIMDDGPPSPVEEYNEYPQEGPPEPEVLAPPPISEYEAIHPKYDFNETFLVSTGENNGFKINVSSANRFNELEMRFGRILISDMQMHWTKFRLSELTEDDTQAICQIFDLIEGRYDLSEIIDIYLKSNRNFEATMDILFGGH